MQTKTHKIDIKHIDENGAFEGYASVFNVVDHQQDIILPGAFNHTNDVKMLWQHDPKKPIGIWEVVQPDAFGLFVKGRLLLDVFHGKQAYILLKAGAVDGLSIGFSPLKSHYDTGKKARIITALDLHEISLVTFAANPRAKVTQVKANYSIVDQITNRIQNLMDIFNTNYAFA